MARRRNTKFFRTIASDYKYNSIVVSKFINCMLFDGKKTTAENIFYKAIDNIKEKTKEEGIDTFYKALDAIKPQIEVKSRRVGGVTYQVPVEVYASRQQSLAIRWIINAARSRTGKTMAQKLAEELIDATNKTGGAYKKKDEVRKMAEANRAFSHYAW